MPRLAVNAHGANTNVSKFLVFCVSAFLAGIGGAILTPISGSINVLSYHPIVSLVLVAVLFIAGSHPIRAAGIAAALHVLLPGYITSREIQPYLPISFGVLAIVSSVLVGRSILRRTADRIAESTRARERVERHPAEARLPQGVGELVEPTLAEAVS